MNGIVIQCHCPDGIRPGLKRHADLRVLTADRKKLRIAREQNMLGS